MKERIRQRGVTLVEVLAASLVAVVVAGGAMSAFIAAARMEHSQSPVVSQEVSGYAQQTIERFRNMIACDSPWFDPVTCAPTATIPTAWVQDPVPSISQVGNESIVRTAGANRCYRVVPQDCDGNLAPTDCFRVEAKVCWNGASCPC